MAEQKSMMHWVVIGLVLAVVVLAFNTGKAPISISAQPGADRNTITVSGEGEVEAMPDEAEIYVRIVNEGTTADAVQAENKEMTNNAIRALKAKGVSSDDIETSSYYLSPRYNWDEKRGSYITGYEATHVIRVTTDDIENTGELVDAAVAGGANSIQDIQFKLSDAAEKEFNSEALESAAARAKDKAETMADALSVRIVRLSSVSESSVSYLPYRYNYAMKDMAVPESAGSAPTPISPEKVTVTASVTLVYEIG